MLAFVIVSWAAAMAAIAWLWRRHVRLSTADRNYEPPPPDYLFATVADGDLRFNEYAKKRMRQRGVTEHDVRYVMARPDIERPSRKGTVSGRWETTGTDGCGRDIRIVWAPDASGLFLWVTNAIVIDKSMYLLTGVWPHKASTP